MRIRPKVAVIAVAVGSIAAAGLFLTTSSADESRYRLATVTSGDIEQSVTYDGTIAAANRVDLTFATEGTVAKVAVSVGDEVEAGDVLAELDAADLKADVVRARADLAEAVAYLDDVEDGQIDTVRQAAGGGSVSPASATTRDTSQGEIVLVAHVTASSDLDDLIARLREQQEAVKEAQTAATEAIAAAKDALATQTEACADGQECQAELQAVQDAQDVVAQKQDDLQAALEALGSTLDDAVAQLEEDSQESTTPTPTPTIPTPTTPQPTERQQQPRAKSGPNTPDSPDSGSTGTAATAADLASAQADVDTAKAALATARADLASATLTAPFDATVASVKVAKGDAVSSADAAVVLIGDGDTTATLSVPADSLSGIDVGQRARVSTVSGDPVGGEVTAIGLLPEATDATAQASTTTYRVTVRIDGDLAAPEGSSVSVELITGTATDVLTVPTSAVTRLSGTTGTVLVMVDGEATRTPVTLGAMGGSAIAVTDGLEKGQEVVVADLDAALPSGDEGTTRGPGSGMM